LEPRRLDHDMLPDSMADSSSMMMDHGVAAMVRTLADKETGRTGLILPQQMGRTGRARP
jgi:hypothetical protein